MVCKVFMMFCMMRFNDKTRVIKNHIVLAKIAKFLLLVTTIIDT